MRKYTETYTGKSQEVNIKSMEQYFLRVGITLEQMCANVTPTVAFSFVLVKDAAHCFPPRS